jgi:hypothetical protein
MLLLGPLVSLHSRRHLGRRRPCHSAFELRSRVSRFRRSVQHQPAQVSSGLLHAFLTLDVGDMLRIGLVILRRGLVILHRAGPGGKGFAGAPLARRARGRLLHHLVNLLERQTLGS